MKPIRHIVCATDFSASAHSAAQVAAAIALRLRVQLSLVHVADEAHAYPEGSKELKTFLRGTKTKLRTESLRLRRTGALVAEVLLHGRWAEHAILEFMEKNPPLLVVVSSVSKTTFDRWTIGSVSERIAQQSPVPTWVVRQPERLLGWARQERRLSVMLAANFTASSDAAVSWIRELRKIGACVVTAVHICWPPDDREVQPPAPSPAVKDSLRMRRRLSAELQSRVGKLVDGVVDVRVEPNWGRPDGALVQLAEEADADLIVLGTHQWHGLSRLAHPSISRGVLRHASMAVACVPVSMASAHGVGQRPQIRRVLVATDFSKPGDQAIPWAYAAVAAGGVVKLIHVLSPWKLPRTIVPLHKTKRSSRGEHRRQMMEAHEKLSALAPPEAATKGITTEVEVGEDRDPARAIGVAARRFGADMICLGSHGRTHVSETLLGSVTRAVAAHNPQPVLLVRPIQP